MQRLRGDGQVAGPAGAVEQVLTVAGRGGGIVAGLGEPAQRRERPLPDLPVRPRRQRQRLFEAQLGVRAVARVERSRGDVDQQAGGGGAKVAALVAGQGLTDVPHGVAAATRVQLDAREVDERLGDDGIVARPPAELRRLLEQRDRGHGLAGASGVPSPLPGDRRLEQDVPAALGEAERRLPVHVRGTVAGARKRRGEIRHRARRPIGSGEGPDVERTDDVGAGARRVSGQLVGEAARQQCRATLLWTLHLREPLEGAIVCGDRIEEAAVAQGGGAGGELIRSIRVLGADWWERHG